MIAIGPLSLTSAFARLSLGALICQQFIGGTDRSGSKTHSSADITARSGMDAHWVPVVPHGAGDSASMLLFCIAVCVQRRLVMRDREWIRTQESIRRRNVENRARGMSPARWECANPEDPYFAPLVPPPPSAASNSEQLLQYEADVRSVVVHSVASWLFMFFHDLPCRSYSASARRFMPVDSPLFVQSALIPLRVCCRQWRALLPALRCCECSANFGPGDFRGHWTTTRYGLFGPLPCPTCYNICELHLSCVRCTHAFPSGESD